MRLSTKLLPVVLLVMPVVLPAQSAGIPTPASVFGFEPGADQKLANYEQVVSYYQKSTRRVTA
jgi:hypothetical protein